MSNTNYDIEFDITYDETYKHYYPMYFIQVAYHRNEYTYNTSNNQWSSKLLYEAFISFDDGAEEEVKYEYLGSNYIEDRDGNYRYPQTDWYNISSRSPERSDVIQFDGIASKVYLRNPHRDRCTFQYAYTKFVVGYNTIAPFAVEWKSVGFVANDNAWFKCATVQRNTYKQYEWVSANVYYKKSTDLTYSSVAGTVSGSWSDVRIDTNLSFSDGYTYDIYITVVADDGSTAQTSVAQFTTTDGQAVATCVSPIGTFLQGEATFTWSHATEYGTPQYAYDLQYSLDNGGSWTTLESHKITTNTTKTATLTNAGVYLWRVRTYNSNDVAGEWASATFVNNMPANPPINLSVNTKGRPTVSWASVSQTAYQVQFLSNDTVVYDSGAVYTPQTSHFVNQYFNDNRAYTVRVRIYNALGEISEWVEVGYQQESVNDVVFDVTAAEDGGAVITVTLDDVFTKYYLQRNNKVIAEFSRVYTDKYAVGLTNYSVVAVTSEEQSDIQTKGFRVPYPYASIVTLEGQQIAINKRVGEAYEIETNNEADINTAQFLGDGFPTHYPSDMRLKSFGVECFDDQEICESLLGQVVYYADNFGNGGYCMVKAYSKTDNFVKNSRDIYANEVSLTLEVTNYDDSIEYPI